MRTFLFIAMAVLASCRMYAQIKSSGNIIIQEISSSEYDNAYKNKLKQPRFHNTGPKAKKLIKVYSCDYSDSLSYYSLDSVTGYLGFQKVRIKTISKPVYLLTVNYPIQSYAYLYDSCYNRISSEMWGGGMLDGCCYAVAKDFDCDEYVHLRVYDLCQPSTYCAEIKEESFQYFIPCFDDRESYFFNKSHNLYFTIMKKWDGSCKYYKVSSLSERTNVLPELTVSRRQLHRKSYATQKEKID